MRLAACTRCARTLASREVFFSRTGKAPKRRLWRIQRGGFEAAPRLAGANSTRQPAGATVTAEKTKLTLSPQAANSARLFIQKAPAGIPCGSFLRFNPSSEIIRHPTPAGKTQIRNRHHWKGKPRSGIPSRHQAAPPDRPSAPVSPYRMCRWRY